MEQKPELAKGRMGQKDAASDVEIETELTHEADSDQFEYSVLSDPLTRLRYVRLTSELVDRVLADKPDTLVFLDKSARPVYWLMRELWPLLASSHDIEGEEVETPPMPEIKFVNIDRGVWIKRTGGMEDSTGAGVQVNSSTVGREINNLRGAFATRHEDVMKKGDEFSNPSLLDYKKVMIVDEVRVSGNTLEIAKQFFEQAFPRSVILTEHWMHPLIGQAAGGSRFNMDVPVWYSDESALGRGIGDLNPAASQQSTHVRLRRGNKFFSRPLEKPDQMSVALRNEIKQLPYEIASGKLPLRLNLTGVDETTLNQRLAFMEMVNHDVSARELTAILERSRGNPEKFLYLYTAAKKF